METSNPDLDYARKFAEEFTQNSRKNVVQFTSFMGTKLSVAERSLKILQWDTNSIPLL
jgi:hypothetical protein